MRKLLRHLTSYNLLNKKWVFESKKGRYTLPQIAGNLDFHIGASFGRGDVVISTNIRNESHDIDQWLRWNLAIGVDHILLFDNYSSDSIAKIIADSEYSKNVSVIPWPCSPDIHMNDYRIFYTLKLVEKKYKFFLNLDVDEFLFWNDSSACLSDLLQIGNEESGYFIDWRCFGFAKSSDNLVNTALFRIDEEKLNLEERRVLCKTKYIVRPEAVKEAHIHRPVIRECYKPLGRNPALILNHYIARSEDRFNERLKPESHWCVSDYLKRSEIIRGAAIKANIYDDNIIRFAGLKGIVT